MRTAATHCVGRARGRRREPLVGDQRGDVLELLGGGGAVDGALERRPRTRRPGSARARPGPSRWCAPAGRRSPGGRWRVGPTVFLQPQARARCGRRRWRSTTTPSPHRGRARPARRRPSPSSRTRAVVSSVKNVWSTTSSNARPPSSSEFGPERDEPERDVDSSNARRGGGTGHDPAGPSWPRITSPAQRRRMRPAKSSICAVVMCGSPIASCSGVDAPAEPEREAAAGEAVHRRGVGRGDHRVAGVVVRRRGGDARCARSRRRPRPRASPPP